MDKFTITINGQKTTVPTDYTVMRAAEDLGIEIPRLCFLKDINETSACRLCVVDVKNMRGLKNSCTLAVYDGMEIDTDTQDIHDSIVANLQLLASNHVFECWACEREHNCELLELMRRYNVENVYGESNSYIKKHRLINDTSSSIVLDSGKCVLCGRCVTACEVHTELGILNFNERGNETYVGPALFHSMADSGCISCGKCIEACPVAAIKEKSQIDPVLDALRDNHKTVVAAVDPGVFVTIAEEFGEDIGTSTEGKVFTSLEQVGFNEVFDLNLAKDVYIQEQASELINHVKAGNTAPLLTSCAPGWINFVEQHEADLVDQLSAVKTPQQVAGALTKHYFAEKLGYHKENLVVVSITPTVSKKDEAARETMKFQGVQDVDYVLTTREYARLLKRKGIHFMKLEDSQPSGELYQLTTGTSSLSADLSILESVLHQASVQLDETPTNLEFKETRGQKGIKEASYKLGGKDINVAVVSDNHTMKAFVEWLNRTKKQYHYIEFLAADNGNIGGGGQPLHNARTQDNVDINGLRLEALEAFVAGKEQVQDDKAEQLYSNYLTNPTTVQNVLHTTYEARKFYK